MGLLSTRWEAEYEGKHLTVKRSEVTRGFDLECDGRALASKAVTLIGLGELEGSLALDGGRTVPIKVVLGVGSECTIEVDGKPIPVRQVK